MMILIFSYTSKSEIEKVFYMNISPTLSIYWIYIYISNGYDLVDSLKTILQQIKDI